MAEISRPLSMRDRSSYAEQIRDKISHFTLTYAWLIDPIGVKHLKEVVRNESKRRQRAQQRILAGGAA